jgi:hypothetical protein
MRLGFVEVLRVAIQLRRANQKDSAGLELTEMDEYSSSDPKAAIAGVEAHTGLLEAVVHIDQHRAAERDDELVAGIGVTAARFALVIDLDEEDALGFERKVLTVLERDEIAARIGMNASSATPGITVVSKAANRSEVSKTHRQTLRC